MEDSRKRSAESSGGDDPNKRSRTKGKKQWRVPRKNGEEFVKRAIQPGDSGIWATCDKGREGKCIGELRDLFNEYAELLYADQMPESNAEAGGDEDGEGGIESEIQQELQGIRKPSAVQLFTPIKIDVQCVVFFRTSSPVDPVALVQRICKDAAESPQRKRTRFTKRLSPMTLIGRASEDGLAKVAEQVLAPHFHQEPPIARKFAIRPSVRNHNILKRDGIIQQVAKAVGPGHKVDLKNYDLLILVEVYTNVCGMSVVSDDFETLKRYNLAELFDPTPKDEAKGSSG